MAEQPPRSMSEAEPDPSKLRTFAMLLQNLEDGVLHQDLTAKIPEVIALLHDVQLDEGGEPSATITLSVKLILTKDKMVEARANFTTKTPVARRPRTLLYATVENNLTRRNPRQRELLLGEVRSVSDAVGAVRAI